FLVHRLGVSSLAWGTLAGTIVGPFLLNAFFAHRAGARYRPILDWRDPGLREWVKLSLPLMVGVSLVTADTWIINHFASSTDGAISLMTYAKRLFAAPMAVLAQAAGVASMPFFASLWAKEQKYEFATGVADSVSRVASLGLLAASGLIALAVPLVTLIYRAGHFTAGDARACAAYFVVFCLSMFLWSAQAIYSRAFYAAGNTLLPMIAGTVVTIVSWPIYGMLYRTHGAMGLAFASDIGITMQTLVLAVLLHRKRMVSLASLDFAEMGRSLLAGVAAGAAVWFVFTFLVDTGARILRLHLAVSRVRDLVILILGSMLWLLIAKAVLERSGSALPRVAMRRLRSGG
ncbi:MAG TPA: lipid II flippase MurJ, partial [Terracidiphilus sp.]|nr:lipid II flippase MurJ [Terracidiphilus sp.]